MQNAMQFLKCLFPTLLFLVSISASAGNEMAGTCESRVKLEKLAEKRCENFDKLPGKVVKDTQERCQAFFVSIQKASASLCDYGKESEKIDAENKDLLASAGNDKDRLYRARRQILHKAHFFHLQWGNRLAFKDRRDIELAFLAYQDSLKELNEFGLGILEKEATGCGVEGSQASLAFVGLALSAGFEGVNAHKLIVDVFGGLAKGMRDQAERDQKLLALLDSPNGRAPEFEVPKGEAHEGLGEVGAKTLITEAITQILHLHGLKSLGLDLVDKLLISKRLDKLDMVVLAIKATIAVMGGGASSMSVGASIGLALLINGGIDYLDHSIRYFQKALEDLKLARMEEVVTFYSCNARKGTVLESGELARRLHNHRQDGICGANCVNPGNFGLCRGSLVFSADRCNL